MVDECLAAAHSGEAEYTIPPGVYRISKPFEIVGTKDFTLHAADVEIVALHLVKHFRLFENINVKIKVPPSGPA